MKKKEYLASLFKENKQCNCKYLARFFFLEKKFNELENLCNDFLYCLSIKDKVDVNIKKVYEQKNYERGCFYKEMNRELNLLIKKRKINLFYNNEKNNYEKEPVSPKKGKKLSEKNKIISASCYKCSQQIAALQ